MMYDSQVHFHTLYEQAPMEFAFRAESQAEFERWQAAFRPRLKQILGLNLIEAQLAGYQPHAQMVDEADLGE